MRTGDCIFHCGLEYPETDGLGDSSQPLGLSGQRRLADKGLLMPRSQTVGAASPFFAAHDLKGGKQPADIPLCIVVYQKVYTFPGLLMLRSTLAQSQACQATTI